MKIIYGGHWQDAPDGWLSIPEQEQDITKTLRQENNSVDCIFSEHVWEHLPFEGAIHFAKEALRVLKAGGILRIAMPTIDKLIQFKNDEIGKHFSDVQLLHYYRGQDSALRELGLDGIKEDPIAFLMDSLLKGHNHRFVWTSSLCKKVLERIGFSEVYITEAGETNFNHDHCLERILRGVDSHYVKEKFGVTYYDPETKIIEAKK